MAAVGSAVVLSNVTFSTDAAGANGGSLYAEGGSLAADNVAVRGSKVGDTGPAGLRQLCTHKHMR